MAESITSFDLKDDRPRHSVAVARVTYVCDSDGTFDLPLPKPIFGSITHIVSKVGATAPTDLADVALLGAEDGADRLQGAGADAISASTVKTTPTMTEATVGTNKYGVNPSVAGFVTLSIANNAVAGATGTLWIYFR